MAGAIDQGLKAFAFRIEPAPQGALADAKLLRHGLGRAMAAEQQLMQHPLHLPAQAQRAAGLRLLQRQRERPVALRVGAFDGAGQPARREDQAGDLCIEVQRCAEQVAVGRGARGPAVGKLHRLGSEARPAKTQQDAVPDGHRHVVDELGAWREMPVHRIAEHNGARLGLQQQRGRTAVVQLQVQQQAAQGRTDSGRMAHEFAQRPQAAQAEALADQQRDMRAVRQPGAFKEQPPGHLQRQPRIRIPEQGQAHARAGKGRLRPCAQVLQHLRDGEDRTDADVARVTLHEGSSTLRRQARAGHWGVVDGRPGWGHGHGRNCRVGA